MGLWRSPLGIWLVATTGRDSIKGQPCRFRIFLPLDFPRPTLPAGAPSLAPGVFWLCQNITGASDAILPSSVAPAPSHRITHSLPKKEHCSWGLYSWPTGGQILRCHTWTHLSHIFAVSVQCHCFRRQFSPRFHDQGIKEIRVKS